MNFAILCLGSNTLDATRILQESCAHLIDFADGETQCSTIYDGPSHNGVGADYFNMVIALHTEGNRESLSRYCKKLEEQAGRLSTSKSSGIMPLDIDIVIWNGDILRPSDYFLPHFTYGYNQLQS